MKIPILHEDESIIVINKPSGLLVHATSEWQVASGDQEIDDRPPETLTGWLADNYPGITEGEWPEPSRPGIVHRLDRDTSGLMLIAKNPKVLNNLQEQFAGRTVEKTYLALVIGAPEWTEQTVRAPVARIAGTKRRAQYLKLDNRAKDAETRIYVLERFLAPNYQPPIPGQLTLIEAHPKTGRTHQIRVHLGLLGYPILGDPWYRTKASRDLTKQLAVPRLMLHAQQLSFNHPTTGERMIVAAPLPADFAAVLKMITSYPTQPPLK